jgi:hypothetical protein
LLKKKAKEAILKEAEFKTSKGEVALPSSQNGKDDWSYNDKEGGVWFQFIMSKNRAYIQQRISSETLLKAAEMQLLYVTAPQLESIVSALR